MIFEAQIAMNFPDTSPLLICQKYSYRELLSDIGIKCTQFELEFILFNIAVTGFRNKFPSSGCTSEIFYLF